MMHCATKAMPIIKTAQGQCYWYGHTSLTTDRYIGIYMNKPCMTNCFQ